MFINFNMFAVIFNTHQDILIRKSEISLKKVVLRTFFSISSKLFKTFPIDVGSVRRCLLGSQDISFAVWDHLQNIFENFTENHRKVCGRQIHPRIPLPNALPKKRNISSDSARALNSPLYSPAKSTSAFSIIRCEFLGFFRKSTL